MPPISPASVGSASPAAHARAILAEMPLGVVDRHGERIGRLAGLYVNRQTHAPEWLLVEVVSPRARYTALPMRGALIGARHKISVAHSAQQIAMAPIVKPSGTLSPRAERSLCRHYRIPATDGAHAHAWERRSAVALVRSPAEFDHFLEGESSFPNDRRRYPRLGGLAR